MTSNNGWCSCILGFLFASSTMLSCTGFLLASEARAGPRRERYMLLKSSKNFDITPDLVRKTAVLAQIQVTEEEVDVLVPRMEEFLGFVETMEEVAESSGGSFATLNCGKDFLRQDTVETFSNVAAVMENMPVEEGSFLRVPKVGEDEG